MHHFKVNFGENRYPTVWTSPVCWPRFQWFLKIPSRAIYKVEQLKVVTMLVSRHRIGKYLPEVVHPAPDSVAVSVCREAFEDTGAESLVLHGSRGWGGWGGWDEQSDFNFIVVHEAASEKAETDRLAGSVLRIRNERYRDSPDFQVDIEDWPCVPTPDRYAALRRTLNHTVARAALGGRILPRDSGSEDHYRHDGDTYNE